MVARASGMSACREAVWDVLADFGGIVRWAGVVDHSSLLRGGPLEPGLTRRVQLGRTVVLERLLDVDAPRTLEYAIEGLPERISSVRNRWTVASDGAGGSQVAVVTTVTVGTRPPQQLAERALARLLARRSDQMLAGLAHHLESHRA